MRVPIENTAVQSAITTPEKLATYNNRILDYTVTIAVLRQLVNSGRLSSSSFNKMSRILAAELGMEKDSIFLETA